MPRQSGHSTAALQLMYDYPDSLLFVPHGASRDYTRRLLADYTTDPDVHKRIAANTHVPTVQSMARINPSWKRPFLIIDQASRMLPKQIELVESSLQASIVLELE